MMTIIKLKLIKSNKYCECTYHSYSQHLFNALYSIDEKKTDLIQKENEPKQKEQSLHKISLHLMKLESSMYMADE